MSQSRTGKTAHDNAVAAADYRAVLASCITNSLDQGQPIFALQCLRATP
jgi:hypothetical protein